MERLSATPGHVIGQGPAPRGQIVPCGGGSGGGSGGGGDCGSGGLGRMGPSNQLGMYCKAHYRRINGLRVSGAILSQMSFFTGMAGTDPHWNAHRAGPPLECSQY